MITNKITVAIPTHDMENKVFFFTRCLDSLWDQTFQDFDIVVTDNSEDNIIKDICDYYKTGISYFRNPNKGMAPNTNEAIRRSKGELIKILYMDDYLYSRVALERIADRFEGEWLVSACVHDEDGVIGDKHIPKWNDEIHLGKNTIGSPSVLTIRNNEPLFFDESMTWLLDCDLYKRYYEKHGEPVIINNLDVAIGLHGGQATHLMGDERKLLEYQYMQNKYE